MPEKGALPPAEACSLSPFPPQVLEFAVNDPATAAMSGPGRPQYEQLLRKLLRAGPAVVMLHHYSYSAQRADGAPPGVFWWPTEQHLSTFARVWAGRAGGRAGGSAVPPELRPLDGTHANPTCWRLNAAL